MWGAFLTILSWVIGFFKPSPEKELGRKEAELEQQEKTIQDVRLSNEVQQSVDDMHDGDAMCELRSKWQRK